MDSESIIRLKSGIRDALYKCFNLNIDPAVKNSASISERPFCLFISVGGVDSRTFYSHFKEFITDNKQLDDTKYIQDEIFPFIEKKSRRRTWLIFDINMTSNFIPYRSYFAKYHKEFVVLVCNP